MKLLFSLLLKTLGAGHWPESWIVWLLLLWHSLLRRTHKARYHGLKWHSLLLMGWHIERLRYWMAIALIS